MWLIKRLYADLLKVIELMLGIDAAKIFDTRLRFHKRLNLKSPETLSEKVTYIELHKQSGLAIQCTDKYAVREYVKSKDLEKILIPIVGGPWEKSDEIDFDNLPDKYVIKATHGCKMNYVVTDVNVLNIANCKKTLNRWLNTTYGSYSIEPHYKQIPHRIYAEYYLDGIDDLIDYKFHCFNGKPEFVLTCSNRIISSIDARMSVTLDLFDMDWNHIPEIEGINSEIAGRGNVERPKSFDEMITIAEILSKDIPFVRIDLYEYKERVLFGEMTFSPACCVFPYFSDKFDKEMGKKLII